MASGGRALQTEQQRHRPRCREAPMKSIRDPRGRSGAGKQESPGNESPQKASVRMWALSSED